MTHSKAVLPESNSLSTQDAIKLFPLLFRQKKLLIFNGFHDKISNVATYRMYFADVGIRSKVILTPDKIKMSSKTVRCSQSANAIGANGCGS